MQCGSNTAGDGVTRGGVGKLFSLDSVFLSGEGEANECGKQELGNGCNIELELLARC